jgi:tetraprenyl-beta-curcumene synthase
MTCAATLLRFSLAAACYWLTVYPEVRSEIDRLQRRAEQIQDPMLRRAALAAMAKRSNMEGAAAFAVLAPRSSRATAARCMVSFQAAYNYADTLAEQPCSDPSRNAHELHRGLVSVFGQPQERSNHLRHHAHTDDGGYLAELLEQCATAFQSLPSHAAVADAQALAAGQIVCFQSHSLDLGEGAQSALERWSQARTPADSGLEWWETAAAAGSSLAVHALIAAAADPSTSASDVEAVAQAYFPWAGALHSVLDSLVDRVEDAATGQFSLIGCYSTPAYAAERVQSMAQRSVELLQRLSRGGTHLVILAGMAGSYVQEARAAGPEDELVELVSNAAMGAMGSYARPVLLVFHARGLLGRAGSSARAPHAGWGAGPRRGEAWREGKGGADAGAA